MYLGLAGQATRGEDAGVNREHRLARFLEFAWAGGATPYLRAEPLGREVFGPVGTTPIVDSIDGWGIRSTAADEGWFATLADSSRFAGHATLLWRGVILGAGGTTNTGTMLGVNYGNGTPNPYSVFELGRTSWSSQDNIGVFRNNGAANVNNQIGVGLSSLYNRPLTIAASNPAGSNSVQIALVDDHGGTLITSFAMNGASGNPALTSASDRIIIGCNLGAGRFANCVTTGAAIWSFAEQGEALLDLAMRAREVFAPSSPIGYYTVVDFAPATAPEITVTGNGNAITDGDGTPSATDHTDFGTTPEGTTKSRTFTIANDGDADLTISSVALSGTDAAEFTITANPTDTITPGNSATLTVRADATTQGTFAATVTINSNDANEAAFDFAIAVEVTAPAAESDSGGGILFGTLGSISMSPRRRRLRSKGKGYF